MHDLPFQFVEYAGIRSIFEYLHSNKILVSRNTVKSDIIKLHVREKIRLKLSLETTSGRICLTSDLWTSATPGGYICLTGHFIDTEFLS